MKDVRKQPYRPSPGLVPQDLVHKKYECPDCGSMVEVPWTEKLEFPKQPIQPNSGEGFFVPAGFPLRCHDCNSKFDVEVEIKENESIWHLYGDEAGRYIHRNTTKHGVDLNFFCITLVALHRRKHSRVQRSIRKLKKSIKPTVDPDQWQHHFTDIWSSKPNSETFSLKNKEDKITYGKELAKIIKKARPELVSFNISGCIKVPNNKKDRSIHIKHLKEDIFSQSILTTLMQMRSFGKNLAWVFDNVKDATDGRRTEGWAEECFLGLQYTRLFTYVSAGAPVLKPEFVQPGSHYLLEIADFISYCVAREFEKAAQNTKTEFPRSLLGKGFYQATLGDGNVSYKWSVGLPLQEYYGI
jgi:hypothetical protein